MAVDWRRGIVLISSIKEVGYNQNNIGTGFVIHQDEVGTYILTCAHVVEDVGGAENVQVRGNYPAEVIDRGSVDGFDLAVLRVEGEALAKLPILPLSLKCKRGDRFESWGYSLLSSNKMKVRKQVEGQLGEALENFSDNYEAESTLWELSMAQGDKLKKGYSGSPVLHCESGAVVGIISHLEGEGERGYAISPEALRHIWREMPESIFDAGVANDEINLVPPIKLGDSEGSFRFEVVTINAEGQEISRTPREAEYQTIDLGNGVTLDMVNIPGGTFWMGTEDEEIERLCQKYDKDYFRREKPRHQVTVAPFWMGKYPVTQAQWQAIMGNNPANFKGEKRPVETVSWHDCVESCQKLSAMTETEFRLPSEAEWEYACRAGRQTPFHFGETITTDLANYDGKHTTEVGTFPPNGFGLYDMHGNVWEWCEDVGHDNYKDAPTDGSAWTVGGTGDRRVLRGGSWFFFPWYCRSAFRYYSYPGHRIDIIGFRVVCHRPRTF